MKWESQDQKLHVDHLMKMGAKLIMEGVDFHDTENVLNVMEEISNRLWRDQSILPNKIQPAWFDVVRRLIPVLKLVSEISTKEVESSFSKLGSEHPDLISTDGKFKHLPSDDDWRVIADWQDGIGKLGKKHQERFIQTGMKVERYLTSMNLNAKDRRVVDKVIASFFPGLLGRWYGLPEKAKPFFFELLDEDLQFLDERRLARVSSKRFD